jgi:hypothetical protein
MSSIDDQVEYRVKYQVMDHVWNQVANNQALDHVWDQVLVQVRKPIYDQFESQS